MSQFISLPILASLFTSPKTSGRDASPRESHVAQTEAASSREEPSSASRLRVARVRDGK